MHLFNRSDATSKNAATPAEKMIPYRENGEVKYIRAEEAHDFTSTGRAANPRKISGWASMPSGNGCMPNAPQLLPERYTDDSVVPVVVTNFIPAIKLEIPEKKSFITKFKKGKVQSPSKVVFMPRREYKKYFAKDKEGRYIGTEPQREWTEEELDDEFGQYQKKL